MSDTDLPDSNERPELKGRFRRWLIFSVLLLLSIVGWGGFSWYTNPTRRAIRSVGGELSEYQYSTPLGRLIGPFERQILGRPVTRQLHLGPRDFRRDEFHQVYNETLRDEVILNIDLDHIGRLMIADISGPHVTNRGFSHVAGNPLVQMVICRRSRITDAGLECVIDNSRLAFLVVPGNDITDAGARAVAQGRSLSYIDLQDTLITDQGLVSLVSNGFQLSRLDVGSTDVTDEGLACLLPASRAGNLSFLTVIQLDVMQCSEIGVNHLLGLTKPLEFLEISSCSPRKQSRLGQPNHEGQGTIDDALMARIAQIKTLTSLVICGTTTGEQVTFTSAGVQSLKSLPALTGLGFRGIAIDPVVLGEIRTACPSLRIQFWPGD